MELLILTVLTFLSCLPNLLIGVSVHQSHYKSTYPPPPSELLNTSQLIHYYGYKSETYKVQTEDGYILPLIRILNKPGPPVLLVSGLAVGPEIYIMQGPLYSLGFLLSDMGYDVWLGRQRGLSGTSHVSLKLSQREFWDFSHDESGYYDLPAMMDLILSKSTYKKIFYGGTSLGSAFYTVVCSERPEYESLFAGSMHFGPAMWFSSFDQYDDLLKFLLTCLKFLVGILDFFGINGLPPNPGMQKALKDFCGMPLAQDFCFKVLKEVTGLLKENIAPDWLGFLLAESYSGTSLRTLAHLVQLTRRGGALKYDWGPKKNLKKYGTLYPPSYNLTKISSPTAIYYSKIDKIVAFQAMKIAISKIGNLNRAVEPLNPTYGHLEFLYAKDLYIYVFKDAINFLDSVSGTTSLPFGRLNGSVWMDLLILTVLTVLSCLPISLIGVSVHQSHYKSTYPRPPSEVLNTSQLIHYYGYKSETYKVQTEDRYILPLIRILNKPGIPVLLVSGLAVGPESYIMHGPLYGLGFLLSGLGYDVWLGGQRGLFGTSHVSLNISQREFWDFSHDESGYYDLPAMMDLILSKSTYKKIFYGGTSLGSTFYMVLCSERPEYESLFAGSIHFGPALWLPSFEQYDEAMKFLLTCLKFLVGIFDFFGINNFPSNPGIQKALKDFCGMSLAQDFCFKFLKTGGLYKENVAPDWLGYLVGECYSGTSLRTLAHLLQLVTRRGGAFKYDWGPKKNLKKYGTLYPPSYDLRKISSPTAIYYSKIDKIVVFQAMKIAISKIGNLNRAVEPLDPTYGHLDFVFAKDLYKYVFKDAINFLDSISAIRNISIN